jgi:hypothetical protein
VNLYQEFEEDLQAFKKQVLFEAWAIKQLRLLPSATVHYPQLHTSPSGVWCSENLLQTALFWLCYILKKKGARGCQKKMMQDVLTLEALRHAIEMSFQLVGCGDKDKTISFTDADESLAGICIVLTGMYNVVENETPVASQLLKYGLHQIQSYYDRNHPSSEWVKSGWNACLCRVPPDDQVALNVRVRLSPKQE